MAIDTRKLESELARIFRSHGVNTANFHGVEYLGISSCEPNEQTGPRVPTMPRSQIVSLATLAQEIAEAFA